MPETGNIELRKASFKGESFYVEASEEVIAQRVAIHEYAGRDVPYVEELGLGKRSIKFTAYFVGDEDGDHLAKRDRFISVCEEGGVGTLVHPFFAGEKRVVFVSSSWQHRKDSLGRISVSLEFIESEALPSPLVTIDSRIGLDQAFREALSIAGDVLNTVHDVINVIDYVRDSSIGIIEDFAATLDNMRISAVMVGESSSILAAEIQDFYDDAVRLVSDDTLPIRIGNLITAFQDGVVDGGNMLDDLLYFGDDSDVVLFDTESRRLQQQNNQALFLLIRRIATITYCRGLANQQYQFRGELVSFRNIANDLIDARLDEISQSDEDDIYIAFGNIRTKLSEDFDKRSEGLGELLQIEVPSSMPSLVNAWRLYQDPLRAVELIDRNRVEHPSWMSHKFAALSV